MQQRNRIALERELYIFQRSDVRNQDRWYCSFKLTGVKRVYKTLGVMTQERAATLARRELSLAEAQLENYGASAVLGRNTISDAFKFFKSNAQNLLSEGRYKQILGDWNTHLYKFFGAKTVIDKRLQKRMAGYVEYRRRVVNKRTGERLHAKISTIKLEIVSAKQMLKLAREAGGIGADVGNLTIGIKKETLREGKSASTTFEHEEVEQIQAHFDSDAENVKAQIGLNSIAGRTAERRLYLLERLRFFVALSFSTGSRVNELRQVRHADFLENFEILRIRKSKTRTGSNRNAVIDNSIWDIKKAYSRYMNYCKTSKKNSLIFAGEEGQTDEQFPTLLKKAGSTFSKFLKNHKMLYEKKHGKRRRNLLATRHYYITKQVDDGQDAFQVSRWCGTSLRQIERTYYELDAKTAADTARAQRVKSKRASLKVVKGGKK